MSDKNFAEVAKGYRLGMGLSLRKFCLLFQFHPGTISKLERGVLPPPRGPRLETYATALGIADDEIVWRRFRDLAAAARGEFPDDLRDEELLRQLPALFRTMRGDPPSDDQLARVIGKLRKR